MADLRSGCGACSHKQQQLIEAQQTASCSYAAASSALCTAAGSTNDGYNIATGMPSNLANDPSSASTLSTQRMQSSIPVASIEGIPQHQIPGQNVWMYPSEQMIYNAMKRKGWDPAEQDMAAVVRIHNTVNERAWKEVLAFERLHQHTCAEPKLKKFMGRPNDVSPKARLLNLMGCALPFDRHDWVVDRCGKEVRYIIDFYQGAPQPGAPAAMFLDARPALDSFEAVWDRLRMQFAWVSSGRWLRE